MRKFFAVLAVVTLVAGVTCAQTSVQSSPKSYSFQSIDFPTATTTQVFGINERGDVVGSYVDTGGSTHGFSLINGRFATIDFPGAILTAARGINDSGTIAGGFARADDPNGVHGFVRHGKKYQQVDFPGSAHSGNLGINEAGDLTGSYDLGDINVGIGFFTKNGRFVSFEVPDSAPGTTGPHGINDSGQVTGFFQDRFDPNITHAFFMLRKVFTTVDYPGASITGFFGINERGDAVGGCTCVDGKGHGLLFSRGVFTFINYPGAAHTRPRAINDRGQIVGFYDAAGATHGFIATPVASDE
jgi:uncharacterized membrane protein